jgi:glycosyltransferase involved in cell wall biosynthesis
MTLENMNIGIFTLRDMNMAGGGWLRIVGPSQYLQELGCKVTLFAPTLPDALDGKVDFVPIKGQPGNPEPWRRALILQSAYNPLTMLSRMMPSGRGLAKMLNSHGLDLIHSHGHSGGFMLMRALPRLIPPVVLDIHTLYRLQLDAGTTGRSRLAHHMTLRGEANLFRSMAALTMESDSQKRIIVEGCGVEANRAFAFPSGADVDFLLASVPDTTIDAVREEVGIAGRKVIFFAGAFKPQGGVLDLIKAFRILAKDRNDLSLLLMGDVVDMASEHRAALDQTDLTDVILLGRQSRERYRLFQRIADVMVVPDIDCGFTRLFPPLKLWDALASGKPSVVTRVESREQMIEDGVTGYLVRPEDPADMAHGLMRALDDPQATEVGQRAQTDIVDGHSFRRTAERLVAVYGEILALPGQ